MEKIEIWKRNKSTKIADCRVFSVREDECETEDGGKKSTFFVIENPDWVNVIALTPDNKVVLIEQFRHGTGETILEIPGGIIDAEDAEPLDAARRELLEETGYAAEKWISLGKSRPNPAIQNNTIYHFLALDAEPAADVKFDEHESVLTKLVDLSEIDRLIEAETIDHSLVLTAFHRFSLYERKTVEK